VGGFGSRGVDEGSSGDVDGFRDASSGRGGEVLRRMGVEVSRGLKPRIFLVPCDGRTEVRPYVKASGVVKSGPMLGAESIFLKGVEQDKRNDKCQIQGFFATLRMTRFCGAIYRTQNALFAERYTEPKMLYLRSDIPNPKCSICGAIPLKDAVI
jgi:hypothetical protein